MCGGVLYDVKYDNAHRFIPRGSKRGGIISVHPGFGSVVGGRKCTKKIDRHVGTDQFFGQIILGIHARPRTLSNLKFSTDVGR